MKRYVVLSLLCLFASLNVAVSQQKVRLSGYIKSAEGSEGVIGATIYINELGSGASTDLNGFYSISIKPGNYHVTYSSVGLESKELELNLTRDLTQNVTLAVADVKLDEVVVSAEKADQNVEAVEMSVAKMDVKVLKKLPAFLGEVDVIKTLITLPGVTTVGEGASGFNVRGGNIDQNLILLDEAPVYSSSHLFGFFSVFNSDVLKDVKLYKGGIPAQYGGRISSVLDIKQKEANPTKFSGSGGIGAVSSRLTLEAPIVKDRSSILISGRRSYADLFLKLSPDEDINGNTAYFYDLNGKINFKLNEKNNFYLSSYYGRDVFKFRDQFGFNWGNTTASLRWNHLFNELLVSNVTALYSNYDYNLGVPSGPNEFNVNSHIINYQLKNDWSYFPSDRHKFEFGASGLYYIFKPGLLTPGEENETIVEIGLPDEYALEPSVYASHEFKVSEKITVQYGLRYAAFLKYGSGKVYQYADDRHKSANSVVDTLQYEANEIISSFGGLEPRVALKIGLDDKSSVKLSYNRMQQFVQLVSNTTNALPTDVWRSASPHVKPLIGDQFAVGYFRNFMDNSIETSVEGFYKDMKNVLDYKNGANLILNEHVEADLLNGQGKAYGLEVMIKKTKGRLTGWVSYTLSRSMRKASGRYPEEQINNGEWYRSNWDKPHDLSVVGTYQVSPRLSLSANFTYALGRPITYPDSKYEFEGLSVANYSSRNQDRIPDYHRLDLSATLEGKKKPDRKWESSWAFSLYNVYGRRNAYSIYFTQNEDNPTQTDVVRLSLLGSVVPSVTYNFNF